MNKPKDFNMEEFEKCYLENYKYLYTVEELGIEKESEREAVSDFENRRYPDDGFDIGYCEGAMDEQEEIMKLIDIMKSKIHS